MDTSKDPVRIPRACVVLAVQVERRANGSTRCLFAEVDGLHVSYAGG